MKQLPEGARPRSGIRLTIPFTYYLRFPDETRFQTEDRDEAIRLLDEKGGEVRAEIKREKSGE